MSPIQVQIRKFLFLISVLLIVGLDCPASQISIIDSETLVGQESQPLSDSASLDLSKQNADLMESNFEDNELEVAGVYGEESPDEQFEYAVVNNGLTLGKIGIDSENVFENEGEPDTSNMVAALASWYGPGFHGHETCSGETFNQNAMTLAAHKWLGETVCVAGNGKRVTAKINDCGPYQTIGKGKHKKTVPHRIRSFDLSKALMKRLKGKAAGLIKVTIQLGPC